MDAAPPTRKQRWYVDVDSKVYGPYDQLAVAQMVERGQILVWTENLNSVVLRLSPPRMARELMTPVR